MLAMLLLPSFLMGTDARMDVHQQEEYYSDMLLVAPQNLLPLPYVQRAQTRIALEKYPEAISDLNVALTLIGASQARDRTFCLGLLGIARLFLSGKNNDFVLLDRAIEALTTAVEGEVTPYSAMYYLSRCIAYQKKFEFTRASIDLISAVRLYQDNNCHSQYFTEVVNSMLNRFLGRSAELLLQNECPAQIVDYVKVHLQKTAGLTQPGLFTRFFNNTSNVNEIKLSQFYLAIVNERDTLLRHNLTLKITILLKAFEHNLSPDCVLLNGYDWHVIEFQDSTCVNSLNFTNALAFYNWAVFKSANDYEIACFHMLRGIANLKYGDNTTAAENFTDALNFLSADQNHERAICLANRGHATISHEDLTEALDLGSRYFNAEELAAIYCNHARCFIKYAQCAPHATAENEYLKMAGEGIITAGNTSPHIKPLLRKMLIKLFEINFCLTAELVLRCDSTPLLREIVQELLIKTANQSSDDASVELRKFYLRLCIANDNLFTPESNRENVIMAEAENQRLSDDALAIMNSNLNKDRRLSGIVLRV